MQPPTPRQRNRASALATRRFSSASQPSPAGSRRTSTQPGALMAGSSANIEDVYEDAEEIVEENGKELDLSRHVVFGSNRSATKAVVQASGHYIQQNSILPQLNAGEWIAYYEVHLLQVSTEDTVSVGIALPGAFLSVELDGSILGQIPNSVGLHSSGRVFHRGDPLTSTTSSKFTRPLRTGDVVGCGLDFVSKQVFYTLNGNLLGIACYVDLMPYVFSVSLVGQARIQAVWQTSEFDFHIPAVKTQLVKNTDSWLPLPVVNDAKWSVLHIAGDVVSTHGPAVILAQAANTFQPLNIRKLHKSNCINLQVCVQFLLDQWSLPMQVIDQMLEIWRSFDPGLTGEFVLDGLPSMTGAADSRAAFKRWLKLARVEGWDWKQLESETSIVYFDPQTQLGSLVLVRFVKFWQFAKYFFKRSTNAKMIAQHPSSTISSASVAVFTHDTLKRGIFESLPEEEIRKYASELPPVIGNRVSEALDIWIRLMGRKVFYSMSQIIGGLGEDIIPLPNFLEHCFSICPFLVSYWEFIQYYCMHIYKMSLDKPAFETKFNVNSMTEGSDQSEHIFNVTSAMLRLKNMLPPSTPATDFVKFWRYTDIEGTGLVSKEFLSVKITEYCSSGQVADSGLNSEPFLRHALCNTKLVKNSHGVEMVGFWAWANAYYKNFDVVVESMSTKIHVEDLAFNLCVQNMQLGEMLKSPLAEVKCSRDLLGRVPVHQTCFYCVTCEYRLLCRVCATSCFHSTHNVFQADQPLIFTCNCSMIIGEICSCLTPDDKFSGGTIEQQIVYLKSLTSGQFFAHFQKWWLKCTEDSSNIHRFACRVLCKVIDDIIPQEDWRSEFSQPEYFEHLFFRLFRKMPRYIAKQDPNNLYLDTIYYWDAIVFLQNSLISPSGELVSLGKSRKQPGCFYLDPAGRALRMGENFRSPAWATHDANGSLTISVEPVRSTPVIEQLNLLTENMQSVRYDFFLMLISVISSVTTKGRLPDGVLDKYANFVKRRLCINSGEAIAKSAAIIVPFSILAILRCNNLCFEKFSNKSIPRSEVIKAIMQVGRAHGWNVRSRKSTAYSIVPASMNDKARKMPRRGRDGNFRGRTSAEEQKLFEIWNADEGVNILADYMCAHHFQPFQLKKLLASIRTWHQCFELWGTEDVYLSLMLMRAEQIPVIYWSNFEQCVGLPIYAAHTFTFLSLLFPERAKEANHRDHLVSSSCIIESRSRPLARLSTYLNVLFSKTFQLATEFYVCWPMLTEIDKLVSIQDKFLQLSHNEEKEVKSASLDTSPNIVMLENEHVLDDSRNKARQMYEPQIVLLLVYLVLVMFDQV
jgi:hypothetical protein